MAYYWYCVIWPLTCGVQETARSGEELTQSVIESQSETQKLQQDLSSEQAKLLHMSAQKGELEQHLEVSNTTSGGSKQMIGNASWRIQILLHTDVQQTNLDSPWLYR